MDCKLTLEDLEYCRICSRRNLRLIAISKEIQEIFYEVTNLELIKTFTLSSLICQTCEKQLKNAKKYREKLLESEIKLQNQLPDSPSCSLTIERVINTEDLIAEDDFDIIEEDIESFDVVAPKKSPPDGKIICPHCHKPVIKAYIKHHIARLHLSIKNFTCDLCSRQFYKKSALAAHMNTHLDSKPIKCPHEYCTKSFASQTALATHVRFHHTTFSSHVCETCGKEYKQKRLLEEHHRSRHSGERIFKCDYDGCGSGFFSSGALRKHLKKCHENKPETCEKCGKIFKSLTNLQAHMRLSHSKIVFTCDFPNCDKKFPNRCFLENHRKWHDDVRDFNCEFCGKNFIRRSHLMRHVESTHKKSQSIICGVVGCGKAFSRRESYKSHLMRVHKNLDKFEIGRLMEDGKSKCEDVVEYYDYEVLDEDLIDQIIL